MVIDRMKIEIEDMILANLSEYTELFVSVFNSEPWNDSWTKETAQIRIENMMKTPPYRSALNGWWSFMVYLVLNLFNQSYYITKNSLFAISTYTL